MGTLGEMARTLDSSTGNALSKFVARAQRSLQVGHASAPKTKAPQKNANSQYVSKYILLEENRKFPISTEKLEKFRNKHAGQRCFIVGNGPSLNKTDLSKLEKEYTFGVNGIFYKTDESGFRPTYYVVEDSFVLKDNLEAIRGYEAEHKFFPTLYREFLEETENTSFFQMNRGFYEKTSPNFRLPRFSVDCADKIYCGQSVTYINLQLAFFMGFTEVYLIGVDFSYVIPDSAKVTGLNIESTEDDPNHFHPEYFGKGKKWHDPQLEMVLRNYEYADIVYRWNNRRVYNATIGGHLEAFERKDFDSLFSN